MAYFLILILTPCAIILSRWINNKAALPVLTTISVYFPFLLEAQVSLLHGMVLLLFWAMLQSILVLYFSFRDPAAMANLIWNAEEYTQRMLLWIESGEFPEGSARSVLYVHLKQMLMYCLLAFGSANMLSLMLGSALLNYMNYYVAQLASGSRKKLLAFCIGWNPWSIVRVIAFLYLGIVFGAPSLSLFLPIEFSFSAMALIPGILGILFDVAVKILVAPSWSRKLRVNRL